jgi:hypothetical protein
MRLSKGYLTILCALASCLALNRLVAQDESVLADIHKRLATPGYEARHDHERMIFVGEIIELGPVFQGVCKAAVGQTVEFRVTEVLLGNPAKPIVRTAYVNCTHQTLPSPPFELNASVIVYCFTNMRSFRCLTPVALNQDRLNRVKLWVARLNGKADGITPIP